MAFFLLRGSGSSEGFAVERKHERVVGMRLIIVGVVPAARFQTGLMRSRLRPLGTSMVVFASVRLVRYYRE